MPRYVEHIVHQAVVAKRHANFQPDSHAHAVLAVQQKLDEARQVKIADFPHPPLNGVLAPKNRSFCAERRSPDAPSPFTVEESSPPESKLHSSTSATICRWTMSSSNSATVLTVLGRSS